MTLTNGVITLRGLRHSDISQLVLLCNNSNISNNLRDYFPNPYLEQNAVEFIESCNQEDPQSTFAIEYEGLLVGTIGLILQKDVYRHSAEIGYWVGEPYWGKGFASQSVEMLVDYGFKELKLLRIYASVFQHNIGSQKVLEKSGFKLDGTFEKAIIKNGVLLDECSYSKLNPDLLSNLAKVE